MIRKYVFNLLVNKNNIYLKHKYEVMDIVDLLFSGINKLYNYVYDKYVYNNKFSIDLISSNILYDSYIDEYENINHYPDINLFKLYVIYYILYHRYSIELDDTLKNYYKDNLYNFMKLLLNYYSTYIKYYLDIHVYSGLIGLPFIVNNDFNYLKEVIVIFRYNILNFLENLYDYLKDDFILLYDLIEKNDMKNIFDFYLNNDNIRRFFDMIFFLDLNDLSLWYIYENLIYLIVDIDKLEINDIEDIYDTILFEYEYIDSIEFFEYKIDILNEYDYDLSPEEINTYILPLFELYYEYFYFVYNNNKKYSNIEYHLKGNSYFSELYFRLLNYFNIIKDTIMKKDNFNNLLYLVNKMLMVEHSNGLLISRYIENELLSPDIIDIFMKDLLDLFNDDNFVRLLCKYYKDIY